MSARERSPRVEVDRPRCPYCHDEIARGEAPAVCSQCHALHHQACFEEQTGCSGCGWKPAGNPAPATGAATRPGTRVSRLQVVDEVRPPLDPATRIKLLDHLAELQHLLETTLYRRWWIVLLPHLYIPVCWPFLLQGLNAEKHKALELVEKVRAIQSTYEVSLDLAQRALLDEGQRWGRSRLFG